MSEGHFTAPGIEVRALSPSHHPPHPTPPPPSLPASISPTEQTLGGPAGVISKNGCKRRIAASIASRLGDVFRKGIKIMIIIIKRFNAEVPLMTDYKL